MDQVKLTLRLKGFMDANMADIREAFDNNLTLIAEDNYNSEEHALGLTPVGATILSATANGDDIIVEMMADPTKLIVQSVELGEDILETLAELKRSLTREQMGELLAWVKENKGDLNVAMISTEDGEGLQVQQYPATITDV